MFPTSQEGKTVHPALDLFSPLFGNTFLVSLPSASINENLINTALKNSLKKMLSYFPQTLRFRNIFLQLEIHF